MKHPIYRNLAVSKQFRAFTRLKTMEDFEALSSRIVNTMMDSGANETAARSYVNRLTTYAMIEKNGHVLISLKQASEWNEDLSKKSLEKMPLSTLRLPFTAYMIDLNNATWTNYEYATLLYDGESVGIDVERTDKIGGLHHGSITINLSDYETVGEAIDALDVGTNLKNLAYKVLSLNLYILMFKKHKARVEEIKVVNVASKRKNIPKHTTTVLYLSQPKYKLHGKAAPGERESSQKSWIVAGHWRHQPVGKRELGGFKTIFVDPFWKGKGSAAMREVRV